MRDKLVILGAGASHGATKDAFPVDSGVLAAVNDRDHPEVNFDLILSGLYLVEPSLAHGDRWRKIRFETVWSLLDNALTERHHILQTGTLDRLPEDLFKRVHTQRNEALKKEDSRDHKKIYYLARRNHRATGRELLINAAWECLMSVVSLYREYQDVPIHVYSEHIPELELKEKQEQFTVVSFNYDTVFERALLKAEIKNHTWTPADIYQAEGIKILKPHGSLNWRAVVETESGQTQRIDTGNHNSIDFVEIGYQAPHSLVQPAIVGLGPKKVFEGGSPDEFQVHWFNAILEQVKLACATAAEVYILGYSVPYQDRYFRQAVTEGRSLDLSNISSIKSVTSKKTDLSQHMTDIKNLFCMSDYGNIDINTSGIQNNEQ